MKERIEKLPIKKILNFENEEYNKEIEDIEIKTDGPWDKSINKLKE